MKRKLDESLETHLTKLMFKAISQSEELRDYLNYMKSEGTLSDKSLLTFCLRPMALVSPANNVDGEIQPSRATAGVSNERLETPPHDDFNEDDWLRKNRLLSPFDS